MKKKSLPEVSIKAAYLSYVTKLRELKEFLGDDKKNSVVEKYKYLLDGLKVPAETLKEVCRREAVIGETVKVLEDEDTIITVSAAAGKVQYDDAKAWELWPPDVLQQVMTVDPAAVERMLAEGELTQKQANKALVTNKKGEPELKLSTPAVTIKSTDGRKF